ncbi:MAG: amidase [Thermoleophilaceae bacterium]
MDSADLAFAGLAAQAELVRTAEVSARELVELYLERIERIDPQLNAYRVVMSERALAEADQADARRRSGGERPLLGVPIAIKDNVDVAGEVTTHGTSAYGAPARDDAEIVKRLRAAGAIVIGKTHLPELAVYPWTESATWGVTRNPWDPQRTTGGSSGGSGAAVAAGLAAAGSASDGGGSIRIPAACCGLFGLKPQRGRVSLMPDAEHWHGLSVVGSLTRSVRDSALWLDVVAGRAEGDAETARPPATSFADAAAATPGRLRVAISLKPSAPFVRVESEVRMAVEETAELLESLGHEVERRDPDYGVPLPLFLPRWLRGIRDDAVRLAQPRRLERRIRRLVQAGGLFSVDAVARARAREPGYTARFGAVFDDFDVLLTPTIPRLPWPTLRFEGLGPVGASLAAGNVIPFVNIWNITGQPAASVPAGFSSDGLPRAVQLVGRAHDETTLLSLAAQIESARPWADRRPPLATGASAATV